MASLVALPHSDVFSPSWLILKARDRYSYLTRIPNPLEPKGTFSQIKWKNTWKQTFQGLMIILTNLLLAISECLKLCLCAEPGNAKPHLCSED